jgi:hypothetical protein
MTRIAQEHGIAFDKDHPAHGGSHDKFFVAGQPVIVPRHNEIVESPHGGSSRPSSRCAPSTASRRDADGSQGI